MSMMPNDRRRVTPPAIPEIAKAYQEDPRTQLAIAAIQAGGSTAPVAGGKWAWADGLARILSSAGGAYFNRKQMQQYGDDEADLLALRAARGQEGLAQAPAQAPQGPIPPALASTPPAMAPLPPVPPENAPVGAFAPAIAGAFGAPAPERPAASIPGLPPAPPAYAMPPARGAVSGGMRPFPATVGGKTRTTTDTSYLNPEYDSLEEKYGAQYGVPPGLIKAIRVHGERTNENQISSAGARTVYQFTPGTRKLFIQKYGVDPWKDRDSAAKAAAIHLAESLKTNNGDIEAAIGEYHGGPDRNRWGKVNNAYRARVLKGLGDVNLGGVPQPDPVFETVPDMPAPVSRPGEPEAVPATRSRMLDAAYKIMADGNRYESADGQNMYRAGLTRQDLNDEAAADRKQRLAEMGFSTDLQVYAGAQSADRGAALQDRADTIAYNRGVRNREDEQAFGTGQRVSTQQFQAGEAEKGRRFQAGEAGKDRNFQYALKKFDRETALLLAETGRNNRNQETQAAADAKRQQFLTTAAGAKIFNETAQKVADAQSAVSALNEFEKVLETTRTGGFILGNAPGLASWSSTDLQRLDSIANQLSLGLASDMKGALSDKDVLFVKSMGPSITKTKRANKADVARLKGAFERSADFQTAKLEALMTGQGVEFLMKWSAYTQSEPITSGKSYSEWLASVPKYDAQGNRIQ